jgi:hypothetical protein
MSKNMQQKHHAGEFNLNGMQSMGKWQIICSIIEKKNLI